MRLNFDTHAAVGCNVVAYGKSVSPKSSANWRTGCKGVSATGSGGGGGSGCGFRFGFSSTTAFAGGAAAICADRSRGLGSGRRCFTFSGLRASGVNGSIRGGDCIRFPIFGEFGVHVGWAR